MLELEKEYRKQETEYRSFESSNNKQQMEKTL
jgi:hypothetical protein